MTVALLFVVLIVGFWLGYLFGQATPRRPD